LSEANPLTRTSAEAFEGEALDLEVVVESVTRATALDHGAPRERVGDVVLHFGHRFLADQRALLDTGLEAVSGRELRRGLS
jgi:uncharacterized membrane protein